MTEISPVRVDFLIEHVSRSTLLVKHISGFPDKQQYLTRLEEIRNYFDQTLLAWIGLIKTILLMSCSLLRKVHATIPRLIQFDATQQTSLFGILVTFQSYVNMQLILSMKSVENIVTLSFYVNTDLSSVSHLTEISKYQI